jgi:hypothetical protein
LRNIRQFGIDAGSFLASGWSNRGRFTSRMRTAVRCALPGRRTSRSVATFWVTTMPPSARFIVGGWSRLVDRLEEHAVSLGIEFKTSRRVTALPDGPVVVAVPLPSAARLLSDPSLSWHQSRTVLLDVALTARPDDPYAVWDLDEAGWAETYTHRDPSLAPTGEHLVQAQVGLRRGEDLGSGVRRVEAILDAGHRDWRARVTWRRRAIADGETGAVDPPGTSWRDRPEVDRGNGVFLVGDTVAAPGMLSEVTLAAALAVADRYRQFAA